MKSQRKPVLGLVILCLEFFSWYTKADIYMHNPRGSNNRLHSSGVNRRDRTRVFDSQNNDKGGYNVGKIRDFPHSRKLNYQMKYWASGENELGKGKNGKSYLKVEWTNQHGCGDEDLNCNLVLQYMCQPGSIDMKEPYGMRDGFIDARPPVGFDGSKVVNEPYMWYQKCEARHRNKGLFTADQRIHSRWISSKHTRQNPRGTRYGFECPEERDYYPYWHPTGWTDIAVLVDNIEDCAYYKRKSFNSKTKGECVERKRTVWDYKSKHNNPKDCIQNGGRWTEFTSYKVIMLQYKSEDECNRKSTQKVPLKWGIPYTEDLRHIKDIADPLQWYKCLAVPPEVDCKKTPYSRSNHLGNGEGVVHLSYDWVLPYFPDGTGTTKKKEDYHRCVLRLRYNISTNDYNVSQTFSESNQQRIGNIKIVQSPIENNPEVDVGVAEVPLKLAINTAQFGRTFQDRSHVFEIKPRYSEINDKTIHNVNVRGKRGNIVQAYPAVEYDFCPKRLEMETGDLVHFQWTGSNTNPRGNAGQGSRGRDRSNVVPMEKPDVSYPETTITKNSLFNEENFKILSNGAQEVKPEDLMVLMATSCQFDSLKEFTEKFEKRYRKKFALLDQAPPFCSAPLLEAKKRGTYYYMCTRNNNFTNRSQKGRIIVK